MSGYCFLFEKPCFKCGIQKPNAEHFLLNCPGFDHERVILIGKIRKLLSNHKLALLKIFNKYLISEPSEAIFVFFGANSISGDLNKKLVRKDPNFTGGSLEKIPILTAAYCASIIDSHNTGPAT